MALRRNSLALGEELQRERQVEESSPAPSGSLAPRPSRSLIWVPETPSPRRDSVPVLHPTETSLLVRVALPAVNWDCLLKFRVKPGEQLEQVQEGVAESVDSLIEKLWVHLEESDFESNNWGYEAAKADCQNQLREWQNNLSEAKAATIRAETAKAEMSKMKESYLKEISQLRQQLSFKLLAAENGEEFVPDAVSHMTSEQAVREATDLTAKEVQELQMQHQTEVEKLRMKNTELLYKLKTKQIQAELQTDLLAKRIDLKEFADAEVQTRPKPAKADASTETDVVDMSDMSQEMQEIQSNDARAAKTARRRPQGPGGPPARTSSRKWPSVRDGSFGDEEELPLLSGSRSCFSRQASTMSTDAPMTREVSFALPDEEEQGISVGVQANFDPPPAPVAPPVVRRRRLSGLPSEKATREEDEEETAAGSFSENQEAEDLSPSPSPSFRRRPLRLASMDSRRGAPPNMRAVTLPTEEQDEAPPMMSISSSDHCAALFSSKTVSDAARPAKRTITRPHLPSPSTSRRTSRCSTDRERPDSRQAMAC